MVVLICFPSLGISPFGHGVLDRHVCVLIGSAGLGQFSTLQGWVCSCSLAFVHLSDPSLLELSMVGSRPEQKQHRVQNQSFLNYSLFMFLGFCFLKEVDFKSPKRVHISSLFFPQPLFKNYLFFIIFHTFASSLCFLLKSHVETEFHLPCHPSCLVPYHWLWL